MENSLKVLINFNEKIIRKQLENYYYYSWKKKLPSILKYFLFITLFLTLIDSIFKANRSRVDFLSFLGTFLIVTGLLYIIIFYFNKANYISKLNKHIDELKKFNPITELYFDENSFYIKSEQYDIRSIWKKITYNISGKTIVINMDMGTQFTYLVDEEETEQYQDILTFLKNKAKPKK
ncbi:hypothetical protein MKS83_10855 [Chryseobacterium sp. Y16C]|uniref:hypothetical protein n=1 Tax=Chryseobacterium sp. Y16C TaxID=2920939 RepID=UPI001F0B712A|nr:hypothetical protein [Chryseobacterium sp. Y16C]UMQ39914.1 hypothetical protein MKS83_10855 [Chryseobacterium sp. Y16C]